MYSKRPYSSLPYSALVSPASTGDPFYQTNWPNPGRRKQAAISQLTWTDSFKLPLQQTPPPHQTDWPVPAGPRRVVDLITWTNPALINVVPDVPLIMQYDWPNPKGPARALDLLTWLQPLTPSAMVFVPEKGENQTDWPNPPLARRRSNQDWIAGSTWVMSQVAQVPPRARNRDFPNPRGPRRSASFLQLATQVRPAEPAVPRPELMLANLTGRVRYLKNEVCRIRFLAKNPNT